MVPAVGTGGEDPMDSYERCTIACTCNASPAHLYTPILPHCLMRLCSYTYHERPLTLGLASTSAFAPPRLPLSSLTQPPLWCCTCPAGKDLRAALDAVLAGQPVPQSRPSMGCDIKWAPGNRPSYYVSRMHCIQLCAMRLAVACAAMAVIAGVQWRMPFLAPPCMRHRTAALAV